MPNLARYQTSYDDIFGTIRSSLTADTTNDVITFENITTTINEFFD